jgi:hypothetical protein
VYWLSAALRPKQTIVNLKDHPNKVSIAVWINVIFAALRGLGRKRR